MKNISLIIKTLLTLFLMTVWSVVMLLIAILTLFQARRFYNETLAKSLAKLILKIWGIKLVSHISEPLPDKQVVFISNHTSTLDVFILIALGLPRCRCFLSGYLRRNIPLWIIASLMGTFFTCSQTKPKQRVKIFSKACKTLIDSKESVYLSPEGERITTGDIGHFNKGAFHLATKLKADIIPIYIQIPIHSNPGTGIAAKPGSVHVFIKPPIITKFWDLNDLEANTMKVRNLFLSFHAIHAPKEVKP